MRIQQNNLFRITLIASVFLLSLVFAIHRSAAQTIISQPSGVPAGATYISDLSQLTGLTESQLYRDPSGKIYKLNSSSSTTPADPVPALIPTPLDADGDGLSDYDEIHIYRTDTRNPDTDGDTLYDGYEVAHALSPLHADQTLKQADTDGDDLNDDWEIKIGTDLTKSDTDGDGVSDYQEVFGDSTSPVEYGPVPVEKRIEVDIKTFTLNYYFGQTLLDTVLISSGAKGYPTPRGEFKIIIKQPVKVYVGVGYYLPNTKWNMRFASIRGGNYYIHGAYWHNLFGKRNVSHGCVNVAYKDMEALYNFTPVGTKVLVQ